MSNHSILVDLLLANSPPVDTVRQSLEAVSERWFNWLLASSAIVALGCVLEVGETWHGLKEWIAAKKPKRLYTPFAAIGLILVIAGVLGEGVFEVLVSNAETAIREHDDQILAETTIKAGAAKDSAEVAAKAADRADNSSSEAVKASSKSLRLAEGATKEADSFERDIVSSKKQAAEAESHLAEALRQAADARREADSFEADIVAAKKQAADAESHLADALQRVAAAEQEATRLRDQLADRSLSDVQIAAIGGKLSRFKGQEFEVTAYWDSPESLGFANRIYAFLASAGWKYNDKGQKSFLMGGMIGVKISVHPSADQDTQTAANLLVKSLNDEGFACREELQNPENNPKHNIISVIVGSKR